MNSSADRSTLESGRDHSVEDRGIGRILTQLIQDMEGLMLVRGRGTVGIEIVAVLEIR